MEALKAGTPSRGHGTLNTKRSAKQTYTPPTKRLKVSEALSITKSSKVMFNHYADTVDRQTSHRVKLRNMTVTR